MPQYFSALPRHDAKLRTKSSSNISQCLKRSEFCKKNKAEYSGRKSRLISKHAAALPSPGWRSRKRPWCRTSPRAVGELQEAPSADPYGSSFGKISSKSCSFSAVSAPIFASKYAFCCIFQNLPDYLAEIFEIWQKLICKSC